MEYDKNASAGRKFQEGILVSIAIMGLFMLVQILVGNTGALAAVIACSIFLENDLDRAMQFAMEIMNSGSYMTMLTVVATFVSAIFSVPAYWIVWGRKSQNRISSIFAKKY